MDETPIASAGVTQAVPLLWVADMDASLAFYVDGLGCRVANQWAGDGDGRWCWLELGAAALMIQGPRREADVRPGAGWTLCLMCDDAIALWRRARDRGLAPARPFVGNGLWVTALGDPDGYRLDFQSPADAPEETEYDGD